MQGGNDASRKMEIDMDDARDSWHEHKEASDRLSLGDNGADDGGGSGGLRGFQWGEDPHQARDASADGSDYDEEAEGLGLMEAFESFNLQAARRVKELLEATDAKLFADTSDVMDPSSVPPPNTPSYILMSDSYRLSRPPQFHHWRQCFPYLQVTGKSSFDEVPDEHIQIRPGPPVSDMSPVVVSSGEEMAMAVQGSALRLETDTSDPPQEELIVADGEMEEVVEEDRTERDEEKDHRSEDDDDESRRPPTGSLVCVSPRTSKAEEAVDRLALEWYAEMAPPLCTFALEKLLHRQQLELRRTRENYEEQMRQAHERAVAAQEEQQRQHEKEEQERLIYQAAVAQAEEEERIREVERREELVRRQLEEHDEEEIKIRTLAYTHMREWYQPKKKCFSHRGRQLTYLKPVLTAPENGQECDLQSVEPPIEPVNAVAVKPRPSILLPRKPSSSTQQNTASRVSSPREADIRDVLSPAESPETSPPRNISQPTTDPKPTESRPSVQLPLLEKPAVNRAPVHRKQFTKPPRKRSWREERSPPAAATRVSATVAAPSRVYKISPYRIPPAILRGELKRDGVPAGRRRHHRQMRTELQDEEASGSQIEQHSNSP